MHGNILIVDDEQDIVDIAAKKIEKEGYSVFKAFHGQEALDVLRHEKIDLVVTDVIMPEMDGFQLFKVMKNDAQLKSIPVIVLTARPNMEDPFRSLGVADFLKKPFNVHSLVEKIDFHIKRRGGGDEGYILVVGSNLDVCYEIADIINEHRLSVQVASGAVDFISKTLWTEPDIILIDILLDDIPAKEVVRAIRCFSKLGHLKILLFANFEPGQMSSPDAVDNLRVNKDECLKAGANKYIGRFTAISLMDSINVFVRQKKSQ